MGTGGCSLDCKVILGWSCSVANGTTSVCKEICGNGILTAGEQCDDGNAASTDGCSNQCQIEK